MRRAEGGAKIFEVFRMKNHDFTPKNHIFSNFRGGGARRVRPPLDQPLIYIYMMLLYFGAKRILMAIHVVGAILYCINCSNIYVLCHRNRNRNRNTLINQLRTLAGF